MAIAAIKGERTIAQISEQLDVHPNQVTTWKAQLEGSAADVLDGGTGVDTAAMHASTTRSNTRRKISLSRKRSLRARERRMIRDLVLDAQAAEPPIR